MILLWARVMVWTPGDMRAGYATKGDRMKTADQYLADHGTWLEGGRKFTPPVGIEYDLDLADLTGADLRDANLVGADMRGAILSGARLDSSELTGVDLRGADLSGSNLSWSDLTGADLRGAELTNAELRRCDLTTADLRGANLNGTVLRDSNVAGAHIDAASLLDACLAGVDLRDAIIHRKGAAPWLRTMTSRSEETTMQPKPKPMRCAMAFIDPISAVHTAIEIIGQDHPGRAPSPDQAEIARLCNEALRAAVAIARQSPNPIEALERLAAVITTITETA